MNEWQPLCYTSGFNIIRSLKSQPFTDSLIWVTILSCLGLKVQAWIHVRYKQWQSDTLMMTRPGKLIWLVLCCDHIVFLGELLITKWPTFELGWVIVVQNDGLLGGSRLQIAVVPWAIAALVYVDLGSKYIVFNIGPQILYENLQIDFYNFFF